MTRVWKPQDLTTRDGAQKHVALIRDYWWRQGHTTVDAWAVPIGLWRKQPVWGVQSNLVNGRPR